MDSRRLARTSMAAGHASAPAAMLTACQGSLGIGQELFLLMFLMVHEVLFDSRRSNACPGVGNHERPPDGCGASCRKRLTASSCSGRYKTATAARMLPRMLERDRQRTRVLLVDDDHDVADSLAEVLRVLDYEVRVTYGGEEALGVAGRYRPDVIILDINMPGMDGLQAARELKRDRRLRSKLFIAHTATDEPLVRRVAAEIGFRRMVIKGSQALIETIDALLELPDECRFDQVTGRDE